MSENQKNNTNLFIGIACLIVGLAIIFYAVSLINPELTPLPTYALLFAGAVLTIFGTKKIIDHLNRNAMDPPPNVHVGTTVRPKDKGFRGGPNVDFAINCTVANNTPSPIPTAGDQYFVPNSLYQSVPPSGSTLYFTLNPADPTEVLTVTT